MNYLRFWRVNCHKMFRIVAFLKFFFSANNQHGVHSPFVYAFVTKCLYTKAGYNTSKHISTLFKSIRYFEVKSIQVHTSDELLETAIQKAFPTTQIGIPPYDLVYLETPMHPKLTEYLNNVANRHNNTVIFLDNIYTSKATRTLWNSTIKRTDITVSIDLFYCGLLFFRREQAKEHFKIRI